MNSVVSSYNQTISLSQLNLVIQQYKSIILDLEKKISALKEKLDRVKIELHAIESLKNSHFLSLEHSNTAFSYFTKNQIDQIIYSEYSEVVQDDIDTLDQERQYEIIADEIETIFHRGQYKGGLHESIISSWIARRHPKYPRTNKNLKKILQRGEIEGRWYQRNEDPYYWYFYCSNLDSAAEANYLLEEVKQTNQDTETSSPLFLQRKPNIHLDAVEPIDVVKAELHQTEEFDEVNANLSLFERSTIQHFDKKSNVSHILDKDSSKDLLSKKPWEEKDEAKPSISDLIYEYLENIYPEYSNVENIVKYIESIVYDTDPDKLPKSVRSVLSSRLDKLWTRPKRGRYKAIKR